MPTNPKYLVDFEEQKCYHITCKSIGKRPLFLSEENKRYFLKRYKDFLFQFVDTFAYNLLHNHVHFIIKTKPAAQIEKYLNENPGILTITHKKYLQGECSFHQLIEQQFHRLFISYSLSFNKQYGINGHLFLRPFKRIEVIEETHFTQACVYVHANNLKHGFKNDFKKYKWSSYHIMLSDKKTDLKRKELLEWFGGRQNFIELHEEMAEYFYLNKKNGIE